MSITCLSDAPSQGNSCNAELNGLLCQLNFLPFRTLYSGAAGLNAGGAAALLDASASEAALAVQFSAIMACRQVKQVKLMNCVQSAMRCLLSWLAVPLPT